MLKAWMWVGALAGVVSWVGCSTTPAGETGESEPIELANGGTVSCGQTVTGAVSGGGSAFDAYSCTPRLSPTGSEWGALFTCDVTGEVVVDVKNFDRRPVVAVLPNPLDPLACITGNYYAQRFNCVAGQQFWIVVDHEGAPSENITFDVQVTCDAPTIETSCDDGFDNDADYLKDCRDPDCIGTAACPVCAPARTLQCGDALIAGNTADFGATDVVDHYQCLPNQSPTSSEFVYTFTPTVSQTVVFTASHASRYPLLTVMKDRGNGCNSGDCIAGNYYSVKFDAEAGQTYYLGVDAAEGGTFNYDVSLVCDAPASEVNCADDIDEDGDGVRDCNDPDCVDDPACSTANCTPNAEDIDCTTRLLPGTTVGAPSVVNDYECLPNLDLGLNENIYDFRYTGGPSTQEVLITLSDETGYAAVASMSGHCRSNACIAGNWYSARFTAQRNRHYYIAVEAGYQPSVDYKLTALCAGDGGLLASEDAGDGSGCSDGYDNDGDNKIDCDDPDCTSVCELGSVCSPQETIDCNTVNLPGSTAAAAATDAVDSYPCAPNLQVPGAEYTYRFDAPSTGWYTFATSNRTGYASVAVLEEHAGTCDPYYCVGANYYSKQVHLEGGKTYWVIVDGRSDTNTVDYQLTVTCH